MILFVVITRIFFIKIMLFNVQGESPPDPCDCKCNVSNVSVPAGPWVCTSFICIVLRLVSYIVYCVSM